MGMLLIAFGVGLTAGSGTAVLAVIGVVGTVVIVTADIGQCIGYNGRYVFAWQLLFRITGDSSQLEPEDPSRTCKS